jgi:hypothetical protein
MKDRDLFQNAEQFPKFKCLKFFLYKSHLIFRKDKICLKNLLNFVFRKNEIHFKVLHNFQNLSESRLWVLKFFVESCLSKRRNLFKK